MEFTLFAFEIPPVRSGTLIFADNLKECESAALELRRELKQLDADDVPAIGIFKCWMRVPDVDTIKHVLNGDVELLQSCLMERKLIAVVSDS
ncbi:hypothetical protein [Rhizobium sp. Root483D2]|uniref:hypothetical protein n=1 Tax=Rhizobium sp. Root483D2 TaxID=1736545 RepID=UPI000712CFD6|nr:hypothetical protein [Rhizobium sp. Root483D2]KQY31845.1 hypothetical protein ASD32_04455 [Rhizobium sp. Root483D2]